MTGATETSGDTAERVELLAQVRLFAGFTRWELERLAPRFAEVEHPKGEILLNEGDEGGDFVVVARGELEVLGGAAGTEVVNRLGPGDHLGEMAWSAPSGAQGPWRQRRGPRWPAVRRWGSRTSAC